MNETASSSTLIAEGVDRQARSDESSRAHWERSMRSARPDVSMTARKSGDTAQNSTAGDKAVTRSSEFWLRAFFAVAGRTPTVLRLLRAPAAWGAVRFARSVRESAEINAQGIFGPDASRRASHRYGQQVVARFFDFVIDVAVASRLNLEQLRAKVDRVDGEEAYCRARAGGKGAVIITAHLGSFEMGLAALRSVERHVHVVFKRDALDGFERIRQSLRQRFGIHEAAIDDGLATWMQLRDALHRNEVVVLQSDRVMPGQKSLRVPFLKGELDIPVGPAKLAIAVGCPVIPIFSIGTRPGRCRVQIEPAIHVDESSRVEDVVRKIAKAIERQVEAHPDQWLVLHRAFA